MKIKSKEESGTCEKRKEEQVKITNARKKEKFTSTHTNGTTNYHKYELP
jgi:hypothetical protein